MSVTVTPAGVVSRLGQTPNEKAAKLPWTTSFITNATPSKAQCEISVEGLGLLARGLPRARGH